MRHLPSAKYSNVMVPHIHYPYIWELRSFCFPHLGLEESVDCPLTIVFRAQVSGGAIGSGTALVHSKRVSVVSLLYSKTPEGKYCVALVLLSLAKCLVKRGC